MAVRRECEARSKKLRDEEETRMRSLHDAEARMRNQVHRENEIHMQAMTVSVA